MKYPGGKGTIAAEIVGYLTNIRQPEQSYWEPFIGGGHIISRMFIRDANVYGSDAHPYLMAMWIARQSGWQPDKPSREKYALARAQAIRGENNGFSDAELGYYGFALSFRGKWFGGYCDSATDKSSLPAQISSEERKVNRITAVNLFCADFMKTEPPENEMLIYCDPPYAGTLDYRGTPPFNHDAFWRRIRLLTEQGHTVLVSEYKAPDGFSCVLEVETRQSFGIVSKGRDTTDRRVEKLFRWGDYQKPQLSLL